MKTNRAVRSEKDVSKFLKSIIWGTLFGCILCAVLLICASFLLVKTGYVNENAINVITLVTTCAGVLFGSYTAVRLAGEKGLIVGSCVGAFMFLIVTAVFLSFNNDSMTKVAVTKAAMMIISGAIGGIFGANKKQKIR